MGNESDGVHVGKETVVRWVENEWVLAELVVDRGHFLNRSGRDISGRMRDR